MNPTPSQSTHVHRTEPRARCAAQDAPPPMTTTMKPPSSARSWFTDIAALALVLGIWFFACFAWRPLLNPDEGRYAEIAREMVASGDWVTPRLNGVSYFEKPPLVYWTIAAAQKLFGSAEWTARATPALFAIFGCAMAYATTRTLAGRRAGLDAALVVATSLLYFIFAGVLVLDMAVSVLISATLFCFLVGVHRPAGASRRWTFYGLYASAALATLTKGLIGFLLPGAIMFSWLLICGQWHRLRPLHLPTGALLFLAIAAPWHVLVAQRNPGWAQFYFVHEHWLRFTTTTHSRVEPWWFYVPILLFGIFPWTGFTWPALRWHLEGGWGKRREDATAWFLVLWAAVVLVFFSAAGSKLIPYILPAVVPLVVLTGWWLARRANTDARGLRLGTRTFVGACALVSIALLAIAAQPGLIRDPARFAGLRTHALCGALLFAAAAVGVMLVARRTSVAAIASAALVLSSAMMWMLPRIDLSSTRSLALLVREHAGPEDRIFHYGDFYHDFTYYAERVVGIVDSTGELKVHLDADAQASGRFIDDAGLRGLWNDPQRVWLVLRKRDAARLDSGTALKLHVIAETPRYLLVSNQPPHEAARHDRAVSVGR